MSDSKPWGATPDEWFHFDLVLGRTAHLLPVVCNPGATISPDSKLKALGKTPSRYNRDRQVTGIAQWTGHVVTEHDFARWSNEPDYGICVRTGHGWLALDCDSEDEDIQADIRKTLVQLLGELPPRRWRANSNKCLYLLAVDGDFRKRIHRLTGDMGIIELLANGQQFVACGTHSSGARIEWDGGLPDEPPAITGEQLETLWQRLAEQLPVSVTTEAGNTKMRSRPARRMIQLNILMPMAGRCWMAQMVNDISAVRLKTATVAGAIQQAQFIFLREPRALSRGILNACMPVVRIVMTEISLMPSGSATTISKI